MDIEKQWAETDPRPRGELLAEIARLRSELATLRRALKDAETSAEQWRGLAFRRGELLAEVLHPSPEPKP